MSWLSKTKMTRLLLRESLKIKHSNLTGSLDMDTIFKFMCFMSSCSALPSWKVMFALMNKDMRSMWPACRSSFSSQTDKTTKLHLPSPNVLKLGQTSAVCPVPDCAHWVQTISSCFKGPYQCLCMFLHINITYNHYFESQIQCSTFKENSPTFHVDVQSM